MAKKSDLIKDKLNALKPNIPTNTRGEAVVASAMGTQPASAAAGAKQERPAKDTAPIRKHPPVKKKVLAGGQRVVRETQPGLQQAEEVAPGEEKIFIFQHAFIFPELVKHNMASVNRICGLMIEEANSLNNLYLKSCWKSAEVFHEAIRKSCTFFNPFPFDTRPFKF